MSGYSFFEKSKIVSVAVVFAGGAFFATAPDNWQMQIEVGADCLERAFKRQGPGGLCVSPKPPKNKGSEGFFNPRPIFGF
jgi:hypothetical protein